MFKLIHDINFIVYFSLICIVVVLNGQRCGDSEKVVRIVGGEETERLQYPWQVLIHSRFNGWTLSCGGSLIDDQWIVTAGHCFQPPKGAHDLYEVQIVLGEYNTSETINPYRIILKGSKVVRHENFDNSTLNYDITMVKLNQQLDFNNKHKYLQPLCLPEKGLPVRGKECFASGWGKETPGAKHMTHVLHHLNLSIVDNAECRKIWGNAVTPQKVCAGGESGKDICSGDSGGPLQCPLANGVWVLEGIVSYATCGAKGFPGVYTRVESYTDWISAVKKGHAGHVIVPKNG